MKERIHLIDSLRGFSLLGILIANMLIFQYGLYGKDEIDFYHLKPFDEFMYIFIKIFVESSFMPIFLFLFGYSIIMLRNKLEANGKRIKWHLFRRFLLLIVFGLLHSYLLWEGDILLSYGLTGILILIFVNRKKKTILFWTITIFIVGSLFSFIPMEEEGLENNLELTNYLEKGEQIYSSGSYLEILDFRNNEETPLLFGMDEEEAAFFTLFLFILVPIITCPILLLGMYAAKSGWFTNAYANRKKYGFCAILFVLIGLILKSIQYIYTETTLTVASYSIGGQVLSIGYIFAFSYFYSGEGQKYLSYFQSIGRLSMSNYLFQTMICTTIFYGYGFGLFGKLGVFNGFILSIAIFLCQVFISKMYLNKWKQGPFEKIMRIGTYLSWSGKVKEKKIKHINQSVENLS